MSEQIPKGTEALIPYSDQEDNEAAVALTAAVQIESSVLKSREQGEYKGFDHYTVLAQLELLKGNWTTAEHILLSQGGVDASVEMYSKAYRWQDAIRVAENHHHSDLASLKANYYHWLIDSGQEAEAGEVKEKEGNYIAAINLYLKGCIPSKAAQVHNRVGHGVEAYLHLEK